MKINKYIQEYIMDKFGIVEGINRNLGQFLRDNTLQREIDYLVALQLNKLEEHEFEVGEYVQHIFSDVVGIIRNINSREILVASTTNIHMKNRYNPHAWKKINQDLGKSMWNKDRIEYLDGIIERHNSQIKYINEGVSKCEEEKKELTFR